MNTHAATLTFSGSLDEVFKAAQRIGGVLNVNVAPGQIITERNPCCSPQSDGRSSQLGSLRDTSSVGTTNATPTDAGTDPTDAQLEALLAKRPELRPARNCNWPEYRLLKYNGKEWGWGKHEASVDDARNAICVRMLERLPESWVLCRASENKNWYVAPATAQRIYMCARATCPLSALFDFWSSQ